MAVADRRHRDVAHHHPRIHRIARGRWTWQCSCGGASPRTKEEPSSWTAVFVDALLHSQLIAP